MPIPAAFPVGFDAIVYRCLEKDAALRFQNVAELAAALVPYGSASAAEASEHVRGILHAASASGLPHAGMRGRSTTLGGANGETRPRTWRRARVALTVAGAATVAVVVLGIVAVSGDEGTPPAEPVTATAAPAKVQVPPPVAAPARPSPPLAPIAVAAVPDAGTPAIVAPTPVVAGPRPPEERQQPAPSTGSPRTRRKTPVERAIPATAPAGTPPRPGETKPVPRKPDPLENPD